MEASAFLPVGVVFFFSGIPALLYQLCWQRMLFTVYGVNIESITVVVSAFMLGLGLGSLAGGRLTVLSKVPPLLLFAVLEFLIAAFGLASPFMFRWVGEVTLGASLVSTAVLSFSLVVFPTVLMGASLPLLVFHLLSGSNNMGRAVGLLYFVNTLGSAAACFLATELTFPHLGLSGSIVAAAMLNGTVAVGALVVHARGRRNRPLATTSGRSQRVGGEAPHPPTPSAEPAHPSTDGLVPFSLVLILSALFGFISLSYEVLLARAYSFVAEGRASAFPLLLGWYLVGIAFGSLASGIYCGRSTASKVEQVKTIGAFLLVVNVFGYLTVPLMGRLVASLPFQYTYPLAALLSGGLGAALPLVTHVGISPDHRAAQRLSYVYVANIVGSTLGSLLTGFFAMDHWGLPTLVLALALLGTLVSLSLFTPRKSVWAWAGVASVGAVVVGAMLTAHTAAFQHIYERLLWKDKYTDNTAPFRHLVETRSGVVSVTRGGMVFGGGVYDGQLSIDPVYDRNSIVRPYIISAFHPAPRRVLVIGLSTGAWTQVILAHPDVREVTAVEINPGYKEVIERSPTVRSLLSNRKLEIVIDDGRRWLARHPTEKFDLIVMNTTFHWHAYAANLLSREFLTEIKAHLSPGGLAIYNTTSSPEAQRTGSVVFDHALRFLNNMYVSTSPLVADRNRLETVLRTYAIDGKRVFDPRDVHDERRLTHILDTLDHFTTPPDLSGFERGTDILARTRGVREITDENMGTEWSFDFSKRK